jgi:NAD(P)-dependent dehydrogenase (short-subunit alcohol dehydrogenase family)
MQGANSGGALEDPNQAASQFAKYPSLQDRVVLITGGASGIGEVLVEAFTLQGAQVVFLDIADEAASALIERLTPNAAHTPNYVHCDLTDSAQLAERLAGIVARFGTIDVVINNAGDDTRHKTEDVTPEFWDRCTAVNLKHQIFVSQAVIPGMKWQGRGVILNMSSISWMIPSTGQPVYIASKAAVVDLTRTLADELAPLAIRVNCIVPGAIETARQRRSWYTEEDVNETLGRQAIKRILQPEEVDRLALFLATDDSSGIPNQSCLVDGGWI